MSVPGTAVFHQGGGSGSGGGVSGLTTADGGVAVADNTLVRGDGGTGVQGSSVTLSDSTGVFTQTTVNGSITLTPNGTGNVLIASGRLQIGGTTNSFPALRNTGAQAEFVTADGSSFATVKAGTVLGGGSNECTLNANGALIKGARFVGFTSSAAGASAAELTGDKDFSLHKNTTTGVVSLAYNDGGVIKNAALA